VTQTDLRLDETLVSEQNPLAHKLLSHDIRSALGGIVSASQALENAGLTGEPALQLAQIHTAALYINDLLSTADADGKNDTISEVGPLLAQLEALWRPAATQKGLSFSITKKGEIPAVIGLPKINFLRIFNNIIGNALKFSSNGALNLLLARMQNGALLFEVVDDGPGFNGDAREKLFSLRGRPESAKAEGSGLGLFIVKDLVEKAGGDITAENRPSGGAKISVIFPEGLLSAEEKQAEKPKTELPDLSHLKILLAEDNPTNQLVATQMLKKMDAQVDTAADGVEAMAKFEDGDYNLGLIDIEMPRKSGLEVMREMRARKDEKAQTTLLALTAYVLPEHKERILAAGADGIIAKPLTDIAAFGNAILIVTGAPDEGPQGALAEANSDADIQMDIYNGLKEIIGQDSMFELLEKVQSDLTEVRSGVAQGVSAKDTAPIRASTHILISVAGAFGAVNLQHLAEALNATANTQDWARILPEAKQCEQGIRDVLTFVNSELKSR